MNLDRIGNITSELSSNLMRSIVWPGGLLDWFSRPLAGRVRDWQRSLRPVSKTAEEAPVNRILVAAGPVVLMGGTPVPDEAVVEMVHLAGGRSAQVAVVPVAAEAGELPGAEGMRLFTRFGMKHAQVVEISSREQANDADLAANLARFDAVLLCGQDVALGLERLRDTECALALRAMQAAGKLVAGIDAGAAIFGDRLLVNHQGEGEFTKGLGIIPGLVVEPAFTQQARFGPLVKALNAEGPGDLMGAGLDAATALVIRNGEAKVLGEGSVTFLDPRDVQPANDAAACSPSSVCGLKVHVLMEGFGMNLRTRKPVSLAKETVHASGER